MDNQNGIRKVIKFEGGLRSKFVRFIRSLKPLDRRKNPRFQSRPPVECMCVYTQSGKQLECSSAILDASIGGLLMMTGKNKIYPGTEVKIQFHIPSYPELISLTGKIIRTSRRLTDDNYSSAVKFQNKEEPGINLLLDFILRKS